MNTFFKVFSFSMVLLLAFTLVANLLPQVQGESPKDDIAPTGEFTPESFAKFGETIFTDKGTCTLCHNNMGRAPDLLAIDVVAEAKDRLQDAAYGGEASNAEDYLRESMLEPSLYVVAGFGKKGTNDTESPMPVVTQAPIQLSDLEINAVIAYLQAKDGYEITVSLPEGRDQPTATPASVQPKAATPEQLITKYNCGACHSILDSTATIGPDLNTVGERLSATQIRESILDPAAIIADGYPPIMPPAISDGMTVRELKLLVAYLQDQTADAVALPANVKGEKK